MKGNRIVYRREDGQWINKKTDLNRASSVHESQEDAEQSARDMLRASGGGELITKGLNEIGTGSIFPSC